jgi:hypothetical protein
VPEFAGPATRATTTVPAAVQSALRSPGRSASVALTGQRDAESGSLRHPPTAYEVGNPGDSAESRADALGDRIARGRPGAFDFGRIRIHSDEQATRSLLSVNALAYTVGQDIVIPESHLPRPGGPIGSVLAHELGHAMQGDTRGIVRRVISPEDAAPEMVGRRMVVTAPFTGGGVTLNVGDSVDVLAWVNADATARVQLPAPRIGAHIPVDVPKRSLMPSSVHVAGIAQYHSGVGAAAANLARGDAQIAAERARPGGERPGEVARMQGLQANRLRTLNRRQIQEMMFNRFDAQIKHWVDFYNARFPRPDALDPNIVKAMLFQETQLGTSGVHMSVVPTHPVKTRFNLGQVIDSSALALLTLMEEIDPTLLTTFHLTNLRTDLAAAQRRGPAQDWETFIWSYVQAGQSTGFQDAVNSFFTAPAAGGPARNNDYDFWIRAAVRWLFEKRRSVANWAEAVRAYNGSGPAARNYQRDVVGRRDTAVADEAAGRQFVPPGI